MYIHNERGLVKIGTGLQGTIRGYVYDSVVGYKSRDRPSELVCLQGKLILFSTLKPANIVVIDCKTLLVSLQWRVTLVGGD